MLTTIFDGRYEVPIRYNPEEALAPETAGSRQFKLISVERGSGILRIGDRRMVFTAPCLLCLNETEAPVLEDSTNLGARGFWFHPCFINMAFDFDNIRSREPGGLTHTDALDRGWLSPFLVREDNYHGLVALGPASAQKVGYILDAVASELSEQPDYSLCRSRSFLIEAFFLIGRILSHSELPHETSLSLEESDIDRVILYIHTEYHRRITLEELAKSFHISKTALTEKFVEAVGVPVMTYLINLRIRLAAMMLRDTGLPIVEIMDRVGFTNSSHFTKTFRKHMGLSPGEYRRNNCWLMRIPTA